jgi:hypothetical protein
VKDPTLSSGNVTLYLEGLKGHYVRTIKSIMSVLPLMAQPSYFTFNEDQANDSEVVRRDKR